MRRATDNYRFLITNYPEQKFRNAPQAQTQSVTHILECGTHSGVGEAYSIDIHTLSRALHGCKPNRSAVISLPQSFNLNNFQSYYFRTKAWVNVGLPINE